MPQITSMPELAAQIALRTTGRRPPQPPLRPGLKEDVTVTSPLRDAEALAKTWVDVDPAELRKIWLGTSTAPPTGALAGGRTFETEVQLEPGTPWRDAWERFRQAHPHAASRIRRIQPSPDPSYRYSNSIARVNVKDAPDTILVNPEMAQWAGQEGVGDLADAVAHEAMHVQQWRNWPDQRPPRRLDQWEYEGPAYGLDSRGEYLKRLIQQNRGR